MLAKCGLTFAWFTENLYKEGLSQQEVDALIQKERRKEERVLKNERKLVCLNCREPGHMVSACPKIVQADGEAQPSICYTVRRQTSLSLSPFTLSLQWLVRGI